MFELNQPLVFPIAPLLTVILALVGKRTGTHCSNLAIQPISAPAGQYCGIERLSFRNGGDHVGDIQRHLYRLLCDSAGVDGGSVRRNLLSFADRQALLAEVGNVRITTICLLNSLSDRVRTNSALMLKKLNMPMADVLCESSLCKHAIIAWAMFAKVESSMGEMA